MTTLQKENKADPNQDNGISAERIDEAAQKLGVLKSHIQSVVFGQDTVIEQVIMSLLAGSHSLLVGVPGLAKTLLIETLSTALNLSSNRIQFTPDLLPSDILGSEVMVEDGSGGRSFRFARGPVFSQLLLADEINRASPRTQSALLQAMQEKKVAIGGEVHDLPQPFHVLATQNPIEQDGTFPLPEAQRDRFLLEIIVPYPDADIEERIIRETTQGHVSVAKTILSAEELQDMQRIVQAIPLTDGVVSQISKLVRSGRPDCGDPDIARLLRWAPGPRAGQALALAAKARAVLDGRYVPDEEDIKTLANPVLRHRMSLSFEARADGHNIDSIISDMVHKAWIG